MKRISIPAVVLAAAVTTQSLAAQSIENRVTAVRDGLVRFSFASRAQVCGNSRNMLSYSSGTIVSTFTTSGSGSSESCERGPIHVVLNRAGGTTTYIETIAGPRDPVIEGARDAGRVPAREAAEYFFRIAATAEGRPARDALLPAMLADSAAVFDPLLALVRDAARPRDIRTSAISWLGRAGGELSAAPRDNVVNALLTLARDANSLRFVRDQSISAINRLPRGDGIAPLLDVIRAEPESPLARYTLSTIATSGDPRVRTALRDIAQRANAADSMRLIAVQGIGRYLATAQDIALLRSLYAGMTVATTKTAIINSVGDFGGAENARWLLARGMDVNEDPVRRRVALQAAHRAEAPTPDLVAVYDQSSDRVTREELMAVYATRGDRAAVDKLIAIARSDTDPTLRKSAINRLSRVDDPRVAAVLREIAIPR